MEEFNNDKSSMDYRYSTQFSRVFSKTYDDFKRKGYFDEFEGTVEADPNDLTDASIDVKIDVNSINTKQEDRDNHLRSEDFFDIENHPQITFKATDIKETSEDRYDVTGDFTM